MAATTAESREGQAATHPRDLKLELHSAGAVALAIQDLNRLKLAATLLDRLEAHACLPDEQVGVAFRVDVNAERRIFAKPELVVLVEDALLATACAAGAAGVGAT
jgi:hypothetical protein